ncbi:hypothetical protein N7G274_002693 [Stereocaulon virgatum]|uniref:Uncharacterized protein n=1 Tax=Stereocaulon virgatum TaxID=373712 RepID=A0ABR4AN94_9LECA
MSSGWVGPGANSSPQNQEEMARYAELKRHLEAEEQERKDVENAKRESLGKKPLKDGVWAKVKKGLKRSMGEV